MLKNVMIVGLLLALSFNQPAHAAAAEVVKVATVNGLVCDVCAEAIRQAMLREPGVRAVKIDLAGRTVTTTLTPDSPLVADAKLTSLLHEAGYDATKVETLSSTAR